MVYGLTGGTGSGKTTVAGYLTEMGYTVIDADVVARSLTEPGSQVLWQLAETFGNEIIAEDGTLIRKKLGDIVFNNKEKLQMLNDICEITILCLADAARYGPVLGQSLFDFESYHAVVGSISLCSQEIIDLSEAFLAVVVVSIDDCKRSVDDVSGRENCLACTPRFCAAFREGITRRKIGAFLESVVHFVLLAGTVFDVIFEDVFKVVLDDEAHPAESCLISIIQTEVHDDIALFSYLVELLVAAVSAAHAGSHNY